MAVCSLLSQSGYYELEGIDADGWPHFKQLKAMPEMNAIDAGKFFKRSYIAYILKTIDI